MMRNAADLSAHLERRAQSYDTRGDVAPDVLPVLAHHGVFEVGLAREHGGQGGEIADAVEAIAWISQQSLTAGFVAWGHRTFIEYLAQSTCAELRERHLPALLAGELAGATGLSNAMKFLSGLEGLQIDATPSGDGYRVDGKLPWVTNLRPEGFIVAAATTAPDNRVLVMAIGSDKPGVHRSADLQLMAMRASNTAALDFENVPVGPAEILTAETHTWLPRVRPAFLALQCGMSIGLARRALAEALRSARGGRHILSGAVATLSSELETVVGELYGGLRSGGYVAQAAPLFALRIRLAEIAQEAVGYELQAAGGHAYLAEPGADFQRRWREAAFLPVITPSLVQLKAALAAHRVRDAA